MGAKRLNLDLMIGTMQSGTFLSYGNLKIGNIRGGFAGGRLHINFVVIRGCNLVGVSLGLGRSGCPGEKHEDNYSLLY